MTLQMRVNITVILAAAAFAAAFPARAATCESLAQLTIQNTSDYDGAIGRGRCFYSGQAEQRLP